LQPYAKQLEILDPFHVPSGRLFFTGIEYAFRDDDSALRKYPHMGEAANVAPGMYRAEFFECEYPEDWYEDLLKQKLSAGQFQTYRLMNTLVRPAPRLLPVASRVAALRVPLIKAGGTALAAGETMAALAATDKTTPRPVSRLRSRARARSSRP
jgi:hypothetical protein